MAFKISQLVRTKSLVAILRSIILSKENVLKNMQISSTYLQGLTAGVFSLGGSAPADTTQRWLEQSHVCIFHSSQFFSLCPPDSRFDWSRIIQIFDLQLKAFFF